MAEPWGAVVLAGGAGVRLGGVDKSGIEVGGQTLLEHALAALGGAAEIVVVGPEVRASRPVTFTREDPAGAGPAAALLHGVTCFAREYDVLVALAVDMPLVTTGTIERLLDAAGEGTGDACNGSWDDVWDGALLDDGRRQPLCAAYRRAALLRTAPGPGERAGVSMRSLVFDLRLVPVPAVLGEGRDVDTWDDLREIRADDLHDPRPGRHSLDREPP